MRWHEASRGLFATAELLVPLRSVRMSVWDQPGLAASLSGFVGNTTLPSRGPNTFSALCPMTFPAGKKLATTNNFPSRDWAWPIPTSRLDFHTIWVKWPAEVTTVSHDSWVMSRAACLTLYGQRATDSNTVIGTLALDGWAVIFGTARRACASWGPAQSPPRCTKCNSPPINGRCTNFISMWHYNCLWILKRWSCCQHNSAKVGWNDWKRCW